MILNLGKQYKLDVHYWSLYVPIAFYAPETLSEEQLVSHSRALCFRQAVHSWPKG